MEECPCRVEVRCEKSEGLVITDKDYRKLVPISAHGENSISGLALGFDHVKLGTNCSNVHCGIKFIRINYTKRI
jgi:hypothetical protein